MIRFPEELVGLVDALRDAEVLGLDVEGDGLYRYRSRLCIIQIGDARGVHVVDALAIEDLSPLAAILGEAGPQKVLHDVSFDRKMLAGRGLPLGNVFDTSIAARFLGEPATGLAALLEARFGVTLDKKHQRADWGVRPIDETQLAYLVADVAHLPALAAQLGEAARALDVLEEIHEETRYAMARALEPELEWAPWTRIKGARELGDEALALLVALADVREEVARAEDVPPFRIAPNPALFEAARRNASSVSELRRVRGLSDFSDDELERALTNARRDGPPPADPPEATPPPELRAERKAREKALGAWRTAEATARGVDIQVVLPGHCLRELVGLPELDLARVASVPGLGAVRAGRYGEALLAVLRDAATKG